MDRLRLDRSSISVVATAALLIATLVVIVEPASAAGPRCRGLRATIVGSAHSERIIGTPRGDVIWGGGGEDLIRGRGGNDVICGGRHSDSIFGGLGHDRIIGGSDPDTLSGRGGHDVISGGQGADVMLGARGNDRLLGRRGADVLAPGRGRDVVNGGRGRDVVTYALSKRRVKINLRRGIARGEGRDRLRRVEGVGGSLRRDRIVGNSRRNVLIGLSGNDRIFGRGGRDELSGGPGGDLLHGGRGVDVVTHVFERHGVRIRIGNPRRDRFRSIEIVEGSLFIDTIIGTRGADHIRGLGESDRLFGQAGDDILEGGDDDDTLVGGAGDDQLDGGDGDSDVIDYSFAPRGVLIDFRSGRVTGDGADRFTDIEKAWGSDFADRVIGDEFSQIMETRGGDDVIEASGGQDKIEGGDGADHIDAGDGFDEVDGEGGDDRIVAGDGDDQVWAGPGSHHIEGGPGDDEIVGGDLDDEIFGGVGVDEIETRSGNDLADGGGDGDWIVFDSSKSAVRVDLKANTATGEGEDRIFGFDNIAGSHVDGDVLIGDDGSNTIRGEGGGQVASDEMFGLGGDDHLFGLGDDLADGGSGSDLCEHAARYVDCELIEPDPPPLAKIAADEPPPGAAPSFEPWSSSDDAGPAHSSSTSVTYQVDFTRSGRIDGSSMTPPLTERWSRDFEGRLSYPVIVDGRVFVTTNLRDESSLVALDASTGATLWTRQASAESVASYAAGRLFWADTDGGLRAIDPATGASIWDRPLPFDLYTDSPPTIHDGVVYLEIGGGSGGLFAIDASTGRFLWGRDFVSGGPGAAAANERGIFVNYAGPHILKYASDSTLLWQFAGCCTGGGGGATVLHEGRAYAHYSGLIVDQDSGEQLGHFSRFRTPAMIEDTGIFMNGLKLEAWDLYGGGMKWSTEGDGSFWSAPLIIGNHVYLVSQSGRLFAIDLDTGAVVWHVDGVAPDVNFRELMPFPGLGASHELLVVPFGNTLKAYS